MNTTPDTRWTGREQLMLPPDPRAGLNYSVQVATKLWPRHEVTTGFVRGGPREWVFVPAPQRVRLVLPSHTGAAAAALRANATGRSAWTNRVMTGSASALALRDGHMSGPGIRVRPVAGRRPARGADSLLADRFGEPVHVAWTVGPARSNRKPVLQVIDSRARTIGFAKASINPLTETLVQREAASLEKLAREHFATLQFPQPLAFVSEDSITLLALSPVMTAGLAVDDTLDLRVPEVAATASAMQELSRVLGDYEAPVGQSSWHRRIAQRASAISTQERPARLDRVMYLIQHLRVHVRFGSWHGDWHQGNFVADRRRATLWDWERFESDAPLGFDAQHLALQTALRSSPADFRDAAMSVARSAPKRLAPWGLTPAIAELVAALHLVDLSVRYLMDRQGAAGASVGAVDNWALPVAEAVLAKHIADTTTT